MGGKTERTRVCNNFLNGNCKNGDVCPFSHEIKKKNDTRFYCHHEGCGKQFVSSWGLKYHLRSHDKDRELFKCSICTKEFTTRSGMTKHMKRHEGRIHICSVDEKCSRAFKTLPELKNHILRVHDKSKMQIPCIFPGCKRRFVFPHDMRRHVETTHGVNVKEASGSQRGGLSDNVSTVNPSPAVKLKPASPIFEKRGVKAEVEPEHPKLVQEMINSGFVTNPMGQMVARHGFAPIMAVPPPAFAHQLPHSYMSAYTHNPVPMGVSYGNLTPNPIAPVLRIITPTPEVACQKSETLASNPNPVPLAPGTTTTPLDTTIYPSVVPDRGVSAELLAVATTASDVTSVMLAVKSHGEVGKGTGDDYHSGGSNGGNGRTALVPDVTPCRDITNEQGGKRGIVRDRNFLLRLANEALTKAAARTAAKNSGNAQTDVQQPAGEEGLVCGNPVPAVQNGAVGSVCEGTETESSDGGMENGGAAAAHENPVPAVQNGAVGSVCEGTETESTDGGMENGGGAAAHENPVPAVQDGAVGSVCEGTETESSDGGMENGGGAAAHENPVPAVQDGAVGSVCEGTETESTDGGMENGGAAAAHENPVPAVQDGAVGSVCEGTDTESSDGGMESDGGGAHEFPHVEEPEALPIAEMPVEDTDMADPFDAVCSEVSASFQLPRTQWSNHLQEQQVVEQAAS